jgi:transposase
MREQLFIGIDLGKTCASVCIMDRHGNIIREFDFAVNKQSVEITAKVLPTNSTIAIENSTNSFAVFQILRSFSHNVVISDPVMTKAIASSKLKTDKVDARTIANLLRSEYLPTIWVPDTETLKIRLLTSHRSSLGRSLTRLKNKVHSVLHRNLIQHGFSDLFGKAGREWLKTVMVADYEKLQISTSLAALESLEKELQEIEKTLAKESYEKENVNKLMSITGVSHISALTILSSIGDISRFPHPKKLSSYFGLVPTVYQSGQSNYHGGITKRGNSNVRWVLTQCANVAVQHDDKMKKFYLKIKDKKGHNKAVVAVANKLTRIIWHMLTNNQDYRDVKPRTYEHKLARLRIKATGIRLKSGTNSNNPSIPKVQGGKSRKVLVIKTGLPGEFYAKT